MDNPSGSERYVPTARIFPDCDTDIPKESPFEASGAVTSVRNFTDPLSSSLYMYAAPALFVFPGSASIAPTARKFPDWEIEKPKRSFEDLFKEVTLFQR